MKDTVISGKQKKRELIIFLICLFAGTIFNLVAIIKYNTPIQELFTQIHVVVFFSVFLYLLVAILRFFFQSTCKFYNYSFKRRTRP